MGGYGSGRPRERPAAELSQAWPVALVRDAVRALLRAEGDALAGQLAEVRASVTWRRGGEAVAELSYRVRRSKGWPDLLMVEAPATDGETLQGPLYPLEPRPSNLGRGVVWYWRCPACHELARVLYRGHWGRWACRRCNPVTYRSSRDSDARVSAILRDPSALAGFTAPAFDPKKPPPAGELAAQARLASAGLFVLLKLAERLESDHAGQGRRWSAARRAAQPKKT